ncbi:hypothetical protein [Thiohalorhabdus sp.]|uniref:hypothetical protein n=1 Tax=Thiohalorhabdus sp. TaxID=3094134 RepID=UPI002FC294D9
MAKEKERSAEEGLFLAVAAARGIPRQSQQPEPCEERPGATGEEPIRWKGRLFRRRRDE